MNQITVQKGTKIIQILPLSEKKIKIGSEPDADIQLSSKEASPSHAEFYFENGNYIIKDLNSESRTFVNCKKIHQPTPLKKSDIINIGQYTIFLDEKIESNLSSYEKTEPEDSPGNTPSLLNKINDVAQKIKTKIEEKTIYKISCAVLLFFSLIIILLILMPGDKETALFKELEMSIQSKDYKQANLIIDSLIKLNPSNQEYLHKKKEIVTFLELQRITRLSDSDDIQDLDEALGLLNQVHSKESNIVREKSE